VEESFVWSRQASDELWSGAVTPLTFSLLSDPMSESMVRRRLAAAGLDRWARAPVFRHVRGRVYVNATLVRDVMSELPSIVLSEGMLGFLPEGLRGGLRSGGRHPLDPRVWRIIAHLIAAERHWTPWARSRLFARTASRVAREFGDYAIVPGEKAPDLADRLAAVQCELGSFLEVVSWAMIYAYVFSHLVAGLLDGAVPEEEALAILAAGAPPIRTFEVHREIEALAAMARADPEVEPLLVALPSSEVVARADAGELGAFGAGLRTLRVAHGHRLLGRDLRFPTWAERPDVLVDMIRRVVPREGAIETTDRHDRRYRAREALGLARPGLLRRAGLAVLLPWAREYYAVRENMRYHADYFLAAFRKVVLASARILHSRGQIADVEDVFHLEHRELEALLRGGAIANDIASIAAARRERFQEFESSGSPMVIDGRADEPDREARVPGSEVLSGRAASPGVVTGVARVVRSVVELDAIQEGDIIVAPATDPGWTTYLSLAGGLVLEVGGLLSHGAIIARELGIPAVVDVRGATSVLSSEERIRVDGHRGVVQIARRDGA
jgi:phosphohistidine swiveling domain-containing protein